MCDYESDKLRIQTIRNVRLNGISKKFGKGIVIDLEY